MSAASAGKKLLGVKHWQILLQRAMGQLTTENTLYWL